MAACSKVAVWAQLPGLPIELYEMEVLKEIGKAIGPILRVDANTVAGTRGRYARLCLQVDLEMPLPRFILIGRFRQAILYEGIGSLCFSCGRMGHQKPCAYTQSRIQWWRWTTATRMFKIKMTRLEKKNPPILWEIWREMIGRFMALGC